MTKITQLKSEKILNRFYNLGKNFIRLYIGSYTKTNYYT